MTAHTRKWQIQVLRFTFIGLPDESVSALGDMQAFLGVASSKEASDKQLMSKSEETRWSQGRLILTSQPNRLDVIYSALPQEGVLDFPSAGDFSEVGKELLKMLQPISIHMASRIACGGVVLHKVSSEEDGNKILAEMLPFVSFESDIKDFSMRVNRQKKYKEKIILNNLFNFSIVDLKLVAVNPTEKTQLHNTTVETAVMVEFDINNAESTLIKSETNCYEMVGDLFERASKILSDGAV